MAKMVNFIFTYICNFLKIQNAKKNSYLKRKQWVKDMEKRIKK